MKYLKAPYRWNHPVDCIQRAWTKKAASSYPLSSKGT
jgi:hypothetical protein